MILFFTTTLTGVIAGILAHLGFNELIDETTKNRSINLVLRYMTGIIFCVPAYLLARWVQDRQYKGKTPPPARVVGDFLIVFLAEGVGVMLPRLWRWWRG